jgi:hypothetical protein
MNEKFLHYLWQYQLLTLPLSTTTQDAVVVLKPGTHNHDSGPDFFNGLVRIGETTWAGNIEIHLNSSDWYKHDHHKDPVYDSIILHVVYENDTHVYRANNDPIPTLELKDNFNPVILEKYHAFVASDRWIPCAGQIATVSHLSRMAWFDRLMAERLEIKASQLSTEIKKLDGDLQEAFYRKLARSFGFFTNGDAFEHLAASLPFPLLSKHRSDRSQLESLLFGQAGMLNRTFKDEYPKSLKKEYLHLKHKYGLKPISVRNWRFMRMRPTNFPTIRISQFASLLNKSDGLLHGMLDEQKLSHVISLLEVSASAYWDDHYIFDKVSRKVSKRLGKASLDTVLINTIIPFLFVFGQIKHDNCLQDKALEWMEKIRPERNTIIKRFQDLGVEVNNAMHSQALIRLKKEYCDNRLCLECGFGRILLRQTEGSV